MEQWFGLKAAESPPPHRSADSSGEVVATPRQGVLRRSCSTKVVPAQKVTPLRQPAPLPIAPSRLLSLSPQVEWSSPAQTQYTCRWGIRCTPPEPSTGHAANETEAEGIPYRHRSAPREQRTLQGQVEINITAVTLPGVNRHHSELHMLTIENHHQMTDTTVLSLVPINRIPINMTIN